MRFRRVRKSIGSSNNDSKSGGRRIRNRGEKGREMRCGRGKARKG